MTNRHRNCRATTPPGNADPLASLLRQVASGPDALVGRWAEELLRRGEGRVSVQTGTPDSTAKCSRPGVSAPAPAGKKL